MIGRGGGWKSQVGFPVYVCHESGELNKSVILVKWVAIFLRYYQLRSPYMSNTPDP